MVEVSKELRKQRGPLEIIDAIYEALPVNSFDPVEHIARKAELDWRTAKRYLDLMDHVFGKQEGTWLEKGNVGEQVGYSRKTKAGRPSKP